MIRVYRFIIFLLIIFSPIILIIRLFKKKEHPKDLKKNFVFFQKKDLREKLFGFMVQVLEKYKVLFL